MHWLSIENTKYLGEGGRGFVFFLVFIHESVSLGVKTSDSIFSNRHHSVSPAAHTSTFKVKLNTFSAGSVMVLHRQNSGFMEKEAL